MDNSTTLKVHSEAIASKSKCFAPSNTHHHITTLNSLLTPTAKQGLANPLFVPHSFQFGFTALHCSSGSDDVLVISPQP